MAEIGRGGRDSRPERGRDRWDDGSSLNIEDRRDNLPPIQQRLWERNQIQNQPAAYAAQGEGGSLPPVGSFAALTDLSWIAQAGLIKNERRELGFDTGRLFDGIVAAKSGIRGLYDPSSSGYGRYEGLRTNIAVLRNYLLSNGVDAARLQTIAGALADGFSNDTWLKRPFTSWLSSDVANVEGVGAGEMYKYLLEVQHKPAILQVVRNYINAWIGVPDRNWGLPPLDDTPFSPAHLAAPPAYQPMDMSGPTPASSFVSRYLNSSTTHLSKA